LGISTRRSSSTARSREADRVDRVQRRHRLLEDDGHLFAAHPSQLRGRRTADVFPAELDVAVHAAVRRHEAEQRHRARALTGSGLADDGEHLTGHDVVLHVDRRWVPGALHPEVDTEIFDLEDGLDARVHCCAHDARIPFAGPCVTMMR
jgi:hypothetical protein